MTITQDVVIGTAIACSFILFGNAITQSSMGVPALLVDFPPPSSHDHAARARLLGRQWPVFWKVGDVFFRPISILGILGYGYTAWAAAYQGGNISSSSSSSSSSRLGDWRVYAISAACHLITVAHSAVNMRPVNEKLNALEDPGDHVDSEQAEGYARTWIKLNTVRHVTPALAGALALTQVLRR